MARKDARPEVSRRKFLAGVAVAGAATTVADRCQGATPGAGGKRLPSAVLPSAQQIAAETGGLREPTTQIAGPPDVRLHGRRHQVAEDRVHLFQSGIELPRPARVADQLRQEHHAGVHHVHARRSRRSRCAHGYFKATGKPQMTLCHGTVGLQHAAMAVYNAWADRVPLIIVGGNDLDASKRPPGVPTVHSAQDINALVRDFTKWDDQPVSLQHFAQSFVRAYKICDDAALRAGHARARRRRAAGLDRARGAGSLHAALRADRRRRTPTRTRCVRPPSSWSTAREPGHRRGPLRADAGRHRPPGAACRADAVPGHRPENRMNFPNTHYLVGGAGG